MKDSDEVTNSKYICETGIFDDWPYGRAVYVNKDKSFAIRIGNVDHLEIMSSQLRREHGKCDVEKAFKNLMRGVAHLDKFVDFAYDENIGYTTSLIKNLGAIELELEFAPKYYKFYRTRMTKAIVAKRFNVDLKISSVSDEDPITLRNKIKFGMTESEIVQDMVNCLQEFFKFEDEYDMRFDVEYKIPPYLSQMHLSEIKDENRSSLLATWSHFESSLRIFHQGLIEDQKYSSKFNEILTEQIWDEYFGQKCAFGFSFKDSFIEAIRDFDERFSARKIVAGSPDAYRKFGNFYAKCLRFFKDERADEFEKDLVENKGKQLK